MLIDNHANPIASVRAKGPGRDWMTASRTDYNFWIIDRNTGNGPFQIAMTDIYGRTVTAKDVKLVPRKKQASTSAPTAAKAPAPKKKAKPAAKPKASPSAALEAPAPQAPVADTGEDLALAAGAPAPSC
ncbi:expansin C-terminal domain-related protein [Couchioplanes caeruleus]|uniref:expansin C-terminal domain-related protein n=1 Tax=Couchioplanes caeruleus TaxID=56438 RepID=UPI000AD9E160|nr:expansin C-terminal domain-related protein [Couchioplanes caeruleus]